MIIRHHYEKLNASKLDNLEKSRSIPRNIQSPSTESEIENLNRLITSNKTESVIKKKTKKLPIHKSQGSDGFTDDL